MTLACPSCGAPYAPDDRFCSSCGTSLRVTCPSCGADQSISAAFCSSCGSSLCATTLAGVLNTADERQERRVVTVLFADLAGSTALGELLDPEDIRELQGELFDLINSEVERFGGHDREVRRGRVLAVFGIPQAHEDDSERAVRAALAVRDGFGSFTDRVQGATARRSGSGSGSTQARSCGREAAARGELMVSGDAVNVAARLQQHAEPGEVLVGRRTQAATTRRRLSQARDFQAKGKRAPLAAWVARRPQPRGGPPLAASRG